MKFGILELSKSQLSCPSPAHRATRRQRPILLLSTFSSLGLIRRGRLSLSSRIAGGSSSSSSAGTDGTLRYPDHRSFPTLLRTRARAEVLDRGARIFTAVSAADRCRCRVSRLGHRDRIALGKREVSRRSIWHKEVRRELTHRAQTSMRAMAEQVGLGTRTFGVDMLVTGGISVIQGSQHRIRDITLTYLSRRPAT